MFRRCFLALDDEDESTGVTLFLIRMMMMIEVKQQNHSLFSFFIHLLPKKPSLLIESGMGFLKQLPYFHQRHHFQQR